MCLELLYMHRNFDLFFYLTPRFFALALHFLIGFFYQLASFGIALYRFGTDPIQM